MVPKTLSVFPGPDCFEDHRWQASEVSLTIWQALVFKFLALVERAQNLKPVLLPAASHVISIRPVIGNVKLIVRLTKVVLGAELEDGPVASLPWLRGKGMATQEDLI